MKAHPRNPVANNLPPGVSEDQLVAAVTDSGYPLQAIVAGNLAAYFSVTEEWGYVDRATGEHRSLDVFGYKTLKPCSDRLVPSLTLLVECKRSELPFVFFTPGVPRIPPGFPSIFGFAKDKFELHVARTSMKYVAPADFARLADLPFVGMGPPMAVAFARAERQGKTFELSGAVPFNQVVLPLVSALTHLRTVYASTPNQPKYFPSIVVCLCVIDAAMVIATGPSENPQLELHPWVRSVRQEASDDSKSRSTQHYVVDCVHQAFLTEYVEEHLLPFSRSVAERLLEKEAIVFAGKATVSDLSGWSWSELGPAA